MACMIRGGGGARGAGRLILFYFPVLYHLLHCICMVRFAVSLFFPVIFIVIAFETMNLFYARTLLSPRCVCVLLRALLAGASLRSPSHILEEG
jgi:hypothetical protein